jgi:16S rRNA (cytidine1402-2'-O)-methyltransferase
MKMETGKLYLVATPLGNLEDITYRALRILAEVDLIAAEDTRHTLKLLNHFEIKRKMVSYFLHNERERTGEIIDKLLSGTNVALVSDAGMPGISDPGYMLVAEAVKKGITVVPIPGASAVITALAASGLPTDSFWFEGFLPRKAKERAAILAELAQVKGTIVIYEAPHRLGITVKHIYEVLGDREAVLARELTKIHEEFIRGTLAEIITWIEKNTLKGEFTLLIAGKTDAKNRQNSTKQINSMNGMEDNNGDLSLRQRLKKIADETGKTPKEIYQLYLQEKGKK